jgi:hypothetical protein
MNVWTLIRLVVNALLLLGALYLYGDLHGKISKTNERVDGFHERLDVLRDFILQKQENEINCIKQGLSHGSGKALHGSAYADQGNSPQEL